MIAKNVLRSPTSDDRETGGSRCLKEFAGGVQRKKSTATIKLLPLALLYRCEQGAERYKRFVETSERLNERHLGQVK